MLLSRFVAILDYRRPLATIPDGTASWRLPLR
jgi:hypothetical protein